jgi:hypothetical protein
MRWWRRSRRELYDTGVCHRPTIGWVTCKPTPGCWISAPKQAAVTLPQMAGGPSPFYGRKAKAPCIRPAARVPNQLPAEAIPRPSEFRTSSQPRQYRVLVRKPPLVSAWTDFFVYGQKSPCCLSVLPRADLGLRWGNVIEFRRSLSLHHLFLAKYSRAAQTQNIDRFI